MPNQSTWKTGKCYARSLTEANSWLVVTIEGNNRSQFASIRYLETLEDFENFIRIYNINDVFSYWAG